MKCISLWEPWLQLIIDGGKWYETRWWRTNHRGPILLHAAQKLDPDAMGIHYPEFALKPRALWPHPVGAIRAVAVITDCRLSKGAPEDNAGAGFRSSSTAGKWLWRLEQVRALDPAIPFRGMQGIFNVPNEVLLGRPEFGVMSGFRGAIESSGPSP